MCIPKLPPNHKIRIITIFNQIIEFARAQQIPNTLRFNLQVLKKEGGGGRLAVYLLTFMRSIRRIVNDSSKGDFTKTCFTEDVKSK